MLVLVSTQSLQVAEEAVEESKEEEEAEPELPSFAKVSNLTLSELGLPPRMFTAGQSVLSSCEEILQLIFPVCRLPVPSLLIPALP